MKSKVYIYGIGNGCVEVMECLCADNIEIVAYIDKYKSVQMDEWNGIKLIGLDEIDNNIERIIVSVINDNEIVTDLLKIGIKKEQIIRFHSFEDANLRGNWLFLDEIRWKTKLMWKHYLSETIPLVSSYPYEIYSKQMLDNKCIPHILSASDAIEEICSNKKSMSRFGDGEFEIIFHRKRCNFQRNEEVLGRRLLEVLDSNVDNLIIAIADNYGDLSAYTNEAASDIRAYMTKSVREEHLRILDSQKLYYNAYISRPYIIYRDKDGAKKRFDNIKRIWAQKEVLVVEGLHTRMGVGNDLFNNTNSIKRILTVDKNCFDLYDHLLDSIMCNGRNKLILLCLGPVATVLAYDLACKGYWAIDIGQIDVEYEWFLRGVEKRCDIPYKNVSEVEKKEEQSLVLGEEYLAQYESEIVDRII